MIGKPLLTLSLLTFTLTSNAVYADSVAGGKRHFPRELRASSFTDNLALNGVPSGAQLAPTAVRCAYHYQGGPKSNLWTCSR
jgi:hypothetical protein